MNEKPIRIMVVDDHPVVRAGICAFIGDQDDMQIVAQFGSAEKAMDALEMDQPDVILMDLRLPGGMSGLEAIRTIRQRFDEVRVLVLTTYEGDEDIHQALEAGASAYIVKAMDYEQLLRGIRRAAAGKTYVPRELCDTMDMRSPGDLTKREREVLRLMAKGMSNRDIAEHLSIVEGTVKCHVQVLLLHFGVRDRMQAVLEALRRGYVQL